MDYIILAGWGVFLVVFLYFVYDRAQLLKKIKALKQSQPQSLNTQRSVIKGQLAEQLFPLIAEKNPFMLSDMRFIGQPVDYIVFVGHTNERVEAIYFVEVKTGKARLSGIQQSIKSAVENKQVYWMTVHFD